jgi:soluble lytic murein transglycosylase
LAAANLADPALAEIRRIAGRRPRDNAILYLMSRLYELKTDYHGVIVTLRLAFPDYYDRPVDSLPDEIWRLFFLERYRPIVDRQAAENNISPTLILGVIRQESAFAEKARSSSDARGLMQILPSTGRDLARRNRIRDYRTAMLYSAEVNIELGVGYLASQLRHFGETELALAAYNAGRTRVNGWLQEYGNLDMAEFTERIPFSETRRYIKNILSNQAHYDIKTAGGTPD